MVHEVGHAHGREHSPCGLGGGDYDVGYPYTDAVIGTWGYDDVNEVLLDPTTYYDFMSYCSPTWVSDYTYNALYDRVVAVNALGGKSGDAAPPETLWLTVGIGLDGALFRGPELRLTDDPGGREQPIEWLDAAGNLVAKATGRFRPHGDGVGGLVLFAAPPAQTTAIRLPGHGTLDW
jgi:hypothetical protein